MYIVYTFIICYHTSLYVLPVISSIDDISSVDAMAFSPSSQASTGDYATGISNRLVALERRLKALEHVRIVTVVKVTCLLTLPPLPFSLSLSLSLSLCILRQQFGTRIINPIL